MGYTTRVPRRVTIRSLPGLRSQLLGTAFQVEVEIGYGLTYPSRLIFACLPDFRELLKTRFQVQVWQLMGASPSPRFDFEHCGLAQAVVSVCITESQNPRIQVLLQQRVWP